MNRIEILFVVLLNIAIFGMIFNFLAITNNYCKMPIQTSHDFFIDNEHSIFQNKSEVKFYYFTDIFGIDGMLMFSLGDFLMFLGTWGVAFVGFVKLLYFVEEKYFTKNGIKSKKK